MKIRKGEFGVCASLSLCENASYTSRLLLQSTTPCGGEKNLFSVNGGYVRFTCSQTGALMTPETPFQNIHIYNECVCCVGILPFLFDINENCQINRLALWVSTGALGAVLQDWNMLRISKRNLKVSSYWVFPYLNFLLIKLIPKTINAQMSRARIHYCVQA